MQTMLNGELPFDGADPSRAATIAHESSICFVLQDDITPYPITPVALRGIAMQHSRERFCTEDQTGHSPFSRNLNSIVPDSGLFDPSRVIFGLNGAHVWSAAARSSSLTNGGRFEMYSSGSWRYGWG